MTLLSMTGYGEAEAVVLGRRTRIELRSINQRYLEVRCRLPRPLSSLEPRLVEAVKARVQRGKVDLALFLEETVEEAGTGVTVDVTLARAYWAEIQKLALALGVEPRPPDLPLLLGLPEVVRLEEPHGSPDAVWPQLAPALTAALDRLAATRAAEGAALGEDLRRRAVLLRELQQRVRQRAPAALAHHQAKLRERVARLLEPPSTGQPPDEARLAQELALLADRLDVEEELTRLDHHLATLSGLLAGQEPGPLGRRLDFLVQELLREANTIGSKANDATIADLVVSVKSELERIREQVQNLE